MTILSIIFLLILGTPLVLLALGYYPKPTQNEPVQQQDNAPFLSKESTFKILCYNVQFMAGKDYVFWFDIPNGNGPDTRPSQESTHRTTQEVARIIVDENPDFVFLQEVDDGAKRTNNTDQLKDLLALLPTSFHNHTSAFYWKSGLVPHPSVLGRAGMKLSIISKHKISSAKRHQLALTPDNIIAKHLGIKRAVLEAHIPFKEGGELVLLNTHLEAFSKQSRTLQKQVQQVESILSELTVQNIPWVIGGDFNLLAPLQYSTLAPEQQSYYRIESEIIDLTNQYASVPSLEDMNNDPSRWFSFNSNDPAVSAPDRTIDYLFYSSSLNCIEKTIRQHDTMAISDHFPIIASFNIKT